ncbi:MAG TPA: outer membrane beta-barrel protein [Granulicella sp.]
MNASSAFHLSRSYRRLIPRAFAACILLGAAHLVPAQATATASKRLDIQAGAAYSNANSDYSRSRFTGITAYADIDHRSGFGLEAEYNYFSDFDSDTAVNEATYEVGGRYSRHYGRFQPYVKAMYGRGVFNYPYHAGSLAYNIFSLGGGTDIRILRHVNGRVGFEYQHWMGFSATGYTPRNDSLTPSFFTAGVAYHF